MLTAKQLQTRSQGISGSEIAAVAGISPYSSPLDVWLRKTGRVQDDLEGNANVMRGTHLGPALAAWYEELTGRAVTHRGAHEQTLVSSEHPIVIATPDGLVHASTRASKVVAVLEVKSPHYRTAHLWGEAGTDEIPDHYVPQVIWEMAAAGVSRAEVGALIGSDLQLYSVPFDAELFAALLESAKRFWADHIEADKAPSPDGSESAREWLLANHPRAAHDVIEGSERAAELMREMKAAREEREAAEKREETAKQELMAMIGDHEGLTCAAGKISWRNNKGSMKTDWEAIVRELSAPEDLIRKYTTERPGPRVFRPTFAK